MEITIHERHTSVSQEIKDLAVEKLEKITKFVHDAHKIEVDFIEQPAKKATQRFVCEVTVHCKHSVLKAHAEALEIGEALELVVDKTKKQAAKLKDRRVKRFHPRKRDAKTHAMISDDDLAALIFEEGQVEDAKIIKIKQLDFKPMEVEEAALQMDLLGHDFFVFQSTDNASLIVLYKRKDGHLGIIQPS